MNIQCRPIIKSDDIEAVVDLHGLIWFTDDRDAIPSHILIALQHAGSLLLGAFDHERIIGFSLAFPGGANASGQRMLWSHATGVLPEYQGRGVGRQLKFLQKQLALQQGYDSIRWTYDPLQAGNAHFNIAQLGCHCNVYHEDFYGQVEDGLNKGLPSDRFEVDWRIATPPPALAKKARDEDKAPRFLWVNESGEPTRSASCTLEEPELLVSIPGAINQVRREDLALAVAWRLATRTAFKTLFDAHYEVSGYIKHIASDSINDRHYGAYILQKYPS